MSFEQVSSIDGTNFPISNKNPILYSIKQEFDIAKNLPIESQDLYRILYGIQKDDTALEIVEFLEKIKLYHFYKNIEWEKIFLDKILSEKYEEKIQLFLRENILPTDKNMSRMADAYFKDWILSRFSSMTLDELKSFEITKYNQRVRDILVGYANINIDYNGDRGKMLFDISMFDNIKYYLLALYKNPLFMIVPLEFEKVGEDKFDFIKKFVYFPSLSNKSELQSAISIFEDAKNNSGFKPDPNSRDEYDKFKFWKDIHMRILLRKFESLN